MNYSQLIDRAFSEGAFKDVKNQKFNFRKYTFDLKSKYLRAADSEIKKLRKKDQETQG